MNEFYNRSQMEPPPEKPWSNIRPETRALFWRGFFLSLTAIAAITLVVAVLGLGVYVYVALTLPPPEELHARAASFVSTKIFDRNGQLLYEVIDPFGGRRTLVRLDDIPESLRNATIASEDPTFYSNNLGFNPLAIARAFAQNATSGEIVSGASTITQQLVKMLFVGGEVSFKRKIKEAVLATEITRTYEKDDILEIYLNEIYLGNMAYGVSAAAETYFGKRVSKLTLGESALLVGIVPSPTGHDPYTHPEEALAARSAVLDLMAKHGYISEQEAVAAAQEPLNLVPVRMEMKAPHFSMYVRQLLEQMYGAEILYRRGLQVETTLDLRLQEMAEKIVKERVAALAAQNAHNAALVAIDPQTGQIQAMVGSADYNAKSDDGTIDGQVNVALSLNEPGSSIKPLTYAAAFERGWAPATMIMDVKTEFPNYNPQPVNYDGKEHGPVSVRTALGCSYNIPAVKALQFVGVPSLLEMCQRLGITTLQGSGYGLALTLGGGDVTLLELTGAYSAFAAGGVWREPTAILRIKDSNGKVISEHNPGPGRNVLDPRIAYLITDVLSDNDARAPMFGPQNALQLSKPAAAKTGTTNNYWDAWTMGYTTSLVTGVWVGNNNNSEMSKVAGSMGAAPIWHDFMEQAMLEAEGKAAGAFPRPGGIVEVEVCSVSGQPPTADCPSRRKDLFLQGSEPKEQCSVHRKVDICQVSGKLATEFCPRNAVENKLFESYPPDGRDWANAQGKTQPPTDKCDVHTTAFQATITNLRENQEVGGVIDVRGSAETSDMRRYRVEYGAGDDPQGWGMVEEHESGGVRDDHLANWSTEGLDNGTYTLRLLVFDSRDNAREARVRVRVRNKPKPTVTSTVTPTPTATETLVPTPTDTPHPTRTPRLSPTPEEADPTSTPEETPIPSAVPTIEVLPSVLPTISQVLSSISSDTPPTG